MASKYDSFWERHLSIISDLISQATSRGISTGVDVSGLIEYGKRESWYGIVDVSGSGTYHGEMVHAGSLGRTICCSGLLEPYSDMKFRFTITQDLKMFVKNVTANEQPIDIPVASKSLVQPDFTRTDFVQPDTARLDHVTAWSDHEITQPDKGRAPTNRVDDWVHLEICCLFNESKLGLEKYQE